MLARAYVIPKIHEGNRIIVMLFGTLELISSALQVLVAGIHVDCGAVREFLAGTSYYLLQRCASFVELVLLQGTKAGLVVLHSLCKTRVISDGLLLSVLLGHLQNSSVTLRKYSF